MGIRLLPVSTSKRLVNAATSAISTHRVPLGILKEVSALFWTLMYAKSDGRLCRVLSQVCGRKPTLLCNFGLYFRLRTSSEYSEDVNFGFMILVSRRHT